MNLLKRIFNLKNKDDDSFSKLNKRYKLDIGKKGEDIAIDFLWEKGYRILARNLRLKGGEIDILALKNDILCFVEVKTRKLFTPESPDDTLDKRKRRAMRVAALRFLRMHNIDDYPSRIDLVNVLEKDNMEFECSLMEDIVPIIQA